ncbi:hypothetical protein EI77_04402 [Prosthecobacter fusiformis]|uniref:Uncharacterized protein n=1 Tax=Prosthecobacter fusiformis TaxID=48464 RepID=A0A4R7RM05_9BACT|nr:hypothetical protein [Prosthecobacter fusiformis]TDU63194.1 hypothetical protein EI77_04402 [Prosthecobacter fusiformis]
MSRRRRLSPPWLPGFWPMVAFLLLLGSVAGYYYGLAKLTDFKKVPPEPAAKPAPK